MLVAENLRYEKMEKSDGMSKKKFGFIAFDFYVKYSSNNTQTFGWLQNQNTTHSFEYENVVEP